MFRCDFCSAMVAECDCHALLVPPSSLFVEGEKVMYFDPAWSACGTCFKLIEAGDINALVGRSVHVIEFDCPGETDEWLCDLLADIYKKILPGHVTVR